MADWKGKSRGTVSGYKIFIFLIKKAGIRSAYTLLIFVSAYFFFFTPRQTWIIFDYFRKKRKKSFLRSLLNTYKNYYVFGQTLIDRVAITSGLSHKYTYEFDGIELIHELSRQNSAGVLISAHVGNFELAPYFMEDFQKKIHLVTTDEESRAIKSYLTSIMSQPKTEFILVKEDLGHIFEINQVIEEKELICFTGDRFKGNTKTLTGQFLGFPAEFPAGPFLLSSRLDAPVLFVYVMREKGRHYHLYAKTATFKSRDSKAIFEAYLKSMEEILDKYPLQWFNYYKFWKD